MKKISTLLLLMALCTSSVHVAAQTSVKKIVLQGFWWDYWNNNYPFSWANYLTELAPRIKAAGINGIWIPPTVKNDNPGSVGYAPFDHYDLGDKYQKGFNGTTLQTTTRVGTKDELLRMIAVMHANGIEVVQDLIMNHVANAGAGTSGAGGQDPEPTYSMQSHSGYKNFRYVSFINPVKGTVDTSATDYWKRNGRWSKNYTNFHPNAGTPYQNTNWTQGDWGPDMSYGTVADGTGNGYGPSSNINASLYHNPSQAYNYMRDKGRDWIRWMTNQTGVDGFRWDAVKHFPEFIQQDWMYNVKYNNGWNNLPKTTYSVGEYVGSKSETETYVNTVTTSNGGNELLMGSFDFNLRAFDNSGGLRGMVYNLGSYNMASLPGAQQGNRVASYPIDNLFVHRTVSFVNNHDTFRPSLTGTGNYNYPSWNGSGELSAHIDPNEVRMSTAYAVVMAMDGNPNIFFEDLFDLGTYNNRWTHDPKINAPISVGLPVRSDLVNLSLCHNKLDFASGGYNVRSSEGGVAVIQGAGSTDHLIIERSAKAIIGITDSYAQVQEAYVNSNFTQGTVLMDYSGANGLLTYTVPADKRVRVLTQPVNPALNPASRHGYSVWAPVPGNVAFSSVQAMSDYLATYTPTRNTRTLQEWEMADDLGDSHCLSLMQGGAIPNNSTSQRVTGKIFSAAGQQVNITVTKSNPALPLMVSLWDLDGNKLAENVNGAAETISYTPAVDGWLVIKIRNANVQAGQTCKVKADYLAPQVVAVNNPANSVKSRVAIWTGIKGTSDITDCGNWEEGKMPDANTNLLVPAWSMPYPVIHTNTSAKNVLIEKSATLTVLTGATLNVAGQVKNGALIGAANF